MLRTPPPVNSSCDLPHKRYIHIQIILNNASIEWVDSSDPFATHNSGEKNRVCARPVKVIVTFLGHTFCTPWRMLQATLFQRTGHSSKPDAMGAAHTVQSQAELIGKLAPDFEMKCYGWKFSGETFFAPTVLFGNW